MQQNQKEKKPRQSILRILQNNLFLLRMAFCEAPYYTFHTLIGGAKSRIIVFIEHVYLIGYVVDAIINERPFIEVFIFILCVFVGVCGLVNVWDNFVLNRIEPHAKERISRRIRMELYQKAAAMDLQRYDDPEYYNDFVWAMGEATDRVFAVMQSVSQLLGGIAGAVVVGGYILTQDSMGLIVVVLSFLGVFAFSAWRNKKQVTLRERMRPLERKRDYISRVFYLSDHAKELRLGRIQGKLLGEFDDVCTELRRQADRGTWPLVIGRFLVNFLFGNFLIDGCYLLYLLYRCIVLQSLSYGTMVILYNSCGNVRHSFWMISNAIAQVQEHSLYIEKIRHFLDCEATVVSPKEPAPLPEREAELVLEHVDFSYGEQPVLRDVCLRIRPGEKVALVGYNGAGKTTLVKLLMRLYDPTAGRILYGGRDIREYSLDEYRRRFETVFQDFAVFAATVRENIVMSDAPVDEERLRSAIALSGFGAKLNSLPRGLDTPLTREFDDQGALLSGGEAQSLAIARALYQNSPILILDEPSSALDPLAEYRLNQTMMEVAADKMVITISHRLSTTKMADRIVMLEAGRVIEEGTHDQLMEQNGAYATMFRLQAEKYNPQKTVDKVPAAE